MLKNLYHSSVITILLWARHILVNNQPHNVFYMSQTFENYILNIANFCLTFLVISFSFFLLSKFYPKHYNKIIYSIFYISLLPLFDFIFISIFSKDTISTWETGRYIYALTIIAYIPVIILISIKFQIEKYGDKIITPFCFICLFILYNAMPQSFGVKIIENEILSQDKSSTPIHLIVFDAMSYDVLNDPDIEHLFPNFNKFLAKDSYVFEDARSPGAYTIASIPKLLTGIQYEDRLREENHRLLIAQSDDQEYQDIPADSSIFNHTLSYGYNNILLGWSIPYCNIFGEYLTYGRVFPHYSRLSQLWPYPFYILLYSSSLQQRDNTINMFNAYLSKIDSSPQNTFFFTHFPIPHEPYVFDSQGFVDQFWETMLKGGPIISKENYVKQMMFVDKIMGEIVKKLKEKNLYDSSLIIITSDEEGLWGKKRKVPLLIKTPFQNSQHNIKTKAHTINIKKMLLNFLNTHVVDIDDLL